MLKIFKPQILPNFELIELENVCRICLHSSVNMLPLFYNEIDSLISEFLPQKLNRKPLEPYQICVKCLEQAKTAYIFKKQCKYSDELIKSMLNEPNTSKTYYEKQTQTDISNFLYPCEKCEKKFESSEILKIHRLKKHQNTPNICRTCGKVLKTIASLRDHFISVHPELGFGFLNNHECQLCGKYFAKKFNLERHLFNVHNINKNFVTKAAISGTNEEDSIFVKIYKYDFSCGNCLENFAVKDLKNHECRTFQNQKILEGNFSNGLQLISDCGKNKVELSVSEQNNECFSVFENNSRTDDDHEENTVENKDEIFVSEIKIEGEKLFAEELKASQKIGAVIYDGAESKEKITREVKTNANPKREFREITSRLCSECGASFKSSNGLKMHIRRHRGEKPFKCRYCDKAFPTNTQQYAHERTHEEDRKYHCTVCPKRYKRYDALQIHMRNHTGERPYKCLYCSMTFTDNSSLKVHYRKHTGERCYCDLCSKSYSTSRSLLNHKRRVHGIDKSKEFSCKDCSEKIIGAIEYEKHREVYHAALVKSHPAEPSKSHHAEPSKPHICSECGSSFKKSLYLSQHMRTHTGEKPYKCQHCDKAFGSQANRDRHKMIHADKKNYICTNCSKAFSTPGELRVHMRIHTGERPYKCSYCPMAFSDNRSLKRHRAKHSGE